MRALLVIILTMLTSGVMANDLKPIPAGAKTAIFAGGCFWCMEPPFDRTAGVLATDPGYSGGEKPNPTYNDIAKQGSGHREVMRVTYDPALVTYEQLLKVFWQNIDPLDDGGQLYDRGNQYKTAIYYADAAEQKAADESKALVEKALGQKVATEVLPAKPFYDAEEGHGDYYIKNPLRYNAYKLGSGREKRVGEVWGKNPLPDTPDFKEKK